MLLALVCQLSDFFTLTYPNTINQLIWYPLTTWHGLTDLAATQLATLVVLIILVTLYRKSVIAVPNKWTNCPLTGKEWRSIEDDNIAWMQDTRWNAPRNDLITGTVGPCSSNTCMCGCVDKFFVLLELQYYYYIHASIYGFQCCRVGAYTSLGTLANVPLLRS